MDDNLLWEQQHGSAYSRLLGYQPTGWGPGWAEITLPLRPDHLNRAGLPHGGLLTTLLDTACGYAGCYCSVPGHVRRCLTLSLTTQYIGQAQGSRLIARGRVIGGGRKIFFSAGEVFDDLGALIATASGTFRYHSGSEKEQGDPR